MAHKKPGRGERVGTHKTKMKKIKAKKAAKRKKKPTTTYTYS